MFDTPPAVPEPLTVHRTRPVESNWQCKKSGECCSPPGGVLMTPEEMAVLRRHVQLRPELSHIEASGHMRADGLLVMDAQPCPFYLFKSCVVYSVRPYNCRRFACMRPDPATEPLEWDDRVAMGCRNVAERVEQSPEALKRARYIQRKAQEWASQHGWSNEA